METVEEEEREGKEATKIGGGEEVKVTKIREEKGDDYEEKEGEGR